MKYRSRTDIVSQILEAANGGATKTRIMYQAYLSYTQLKEYIGILAGNGLLEFDGQNNEYKTTEKGMQYIKSYQQMSEISGLSEPLAR